MTASKEQEDQKIESGLKRLYGGTWPTKPDFDKDALIAEIVGMLRRNESLKLSVDTGVSLAGFWIGLGIVAAALIMKGVF